MEERDYLQQVDTLFQKVEDIIDEMEFDLDVDVSGGLVTVGFPNGSTVVLSRQMAVKEIWVAARSGGFHLAHDGQHWRCGTTGENFSVLLNRVFSEQLGSAVDVFAW